MRWLALAAVLLSSSIAAAPNARAADPDPLSFWSDGQAELSGYGLKQPRYGQIRSGSVVLIFVKETFSESARVKADDGKHPAADQVDALKLNVVKDFQTGIYDYNLMTSVFAAFGSRGGRRPGAPIKAVFSSQEWCGALFEELLFDAQEIRQRRFSYFDGEADETRSLAYPADAIGVDELPIFFRGIPAAPAQLPPGGSRAVTFLPSLERTRLTHHKLDFIKGKISRGDTPTTISVPAGKFEVETFKAELENGDRYEYQIERAHPHHVVAWRGPEGEQAELRGSARLKYWELNKEGGEKYLQQLGLKPMPKLP